MSVTITIVIDDTGTAMSAQAEGAPGLVVTSQGHAETDAAPPTLVGGPEGGARDGFSDLVDNLPPLEPAELGLGSDTGHDGGGGPAPAELLVEPDHADPGGASGEPMPLKELGEPPKPAARRSARAK